MSKPRILFYDIETAGVNALKPDLGFVVCFGYKWSDEPDAYCLMSNEDDLHHFTDANILKKASKIIEQADLVVGHYASVFDRRFIQGRLLINGLPPIPPTKMRDTCMIARSVANFSSNKLGHLTNILGLDQRKYEKKSGNDWPGWWFKVMQGNLQALREMAAYCKQDVLATEALYNKLLPFDNAHPRIVNRRDLCAICGGEVEYRGWAYVGVRKYRRYVCKSCRKWDRSRTAAPWEKAA